MPDLPDLPAWLQGQRMQRCHFRELRRFSVQIQIVWHWDVGAEARSEPHLLKERKGQGAPPTRAQEGCGMVS